MALALAACGGGASIDEWCETLNTPLPDLEDPVSGEDFEMWSRASFERNEELLEVSPSEVKDAVQTWVDFDKEWLSFVEENDVENWFDVPRVFWSEESGLEEQDMESAFQEILAFAEENGCAPGQG